MGGRRFRGAVVALLCSVAGCADDVLYGGGSGSAGVAGLVGESLGDFDSDRPPSAIVDGFDVTIEKIAGGDVEISWTSQGVSTYEVWTSSDPYFVPGEPGATMEQSSSALSFVDDMGGEGYYRVVAEGATEELSTTVGQRTSTLYRFYTKLGLCLVSDVDTWPELDADMPSNPSSASLWIGSNQSWRVPPSLNTTVFGPGEVIAVQHLQNPAPSPNTYTEIGYVPTASDVSIPLYAGDNLVTTVPYRFGPIMASELLEQVENATRIGRWDAATQTLDWHPEDGDWEIPPCSPVHVEVSAASTWPPPAPPEDPLPPDPSEVAPPLDTTVTTRFVTQVSFLYDAEEPIQTGVDPEDIDPVRVAVLRGRVLDEEGEPLPGVEVSVKDHPEFGATLSRVDGGYDLVVNGGGWLSVELRTEARVPAQRTVNVPWEQFTVVDNVVLVERDPAVTTIDFSDPIELAVGSEITDADGTRQPVLLFAEDTVATMHMPGGATEPLPSISVRMTEATVGGLGPQRMPADLPPTSMYTYAIDFSIDEAETAGAESVSFDPPVISYNENFIGFPVGQVVPVGSYDMTRSAWMPEPNGIVLGIVSETGGLANLDLDGNGIAENGAAYTAAGISDDERETVADLYDPGDELWRVVVDHFSPWDCNWGFRPPDDADFPPPDGPRQPHPDDNACLTPGSIIECQGQVMGERIPITGTPFSLNYRSDRVPGREYAYTVNLPISESTLHPALQRIESRITVAGRLLEASFEPASDETYSVTWDGLDVYGRRVQAPARADVCLGFTYAPAYSDMNQAGAEAFGFSGGSGLSMTGDRDAAEVTLWRCYPPPEGSGAMALGVWDARTGSAALGGWTLSIHHTLAPDAGILYLGDGRRLSNTQALPIITTVGGGGSSTETGIPATDASMAAFALAAGPDGSLYVGLGRYVRRIDPAGLVHAFAGQPTNVDGFSGDGGPAVDAEMGVIRGITVSADGSVYLADSANRRVRRVRPDGDIETIAGNGSSGVGGDGGPATSATLSNPHGLAIAADGTLYIAQDANGRVRRVSPDGTISTFVGGTCTSGAPDGKSANEDCMCQIEGIALGPNGSLYFTAEPDCVGSFPNSVYRVGLDHRFERFAGGGTPSDQVGDGLAAISARLHAPTGIAVANDGTVYISEALGFGGGGGRRVRAVRHDGTIRTVAGGAPNTFALGEHGPATSTYLGSPHAIAIGPDRALYIAHTSFGGRVRRVSFPLERATGDILVSSEDASEIYVFSPDGRHQSTVDAVTGATRWTFGYNTTGHLQSVTDRFFATTTITRDGNGEATVIVGPDGHETLLSIPPGGYLEEIENPEGEVHAFAYDSNGLLTSHTSPRLDTSEYEYNEAGLLELSSGPEGGSKALVRSEFGSAGYEVAMTTGLGRASSYSVELQANGDKRYANAAPSGQTIETITRRDGSSTTNYSDGTVVEISETPDPRFGMQSPMRTATTLTPGGRERVEAWTRTATIATPGDPLSMTNYIESYTLNGDTWTSTWNDSTDTIILESPEGRIFTRTLNAASQPELAEIDTLAALTLDYDARGRPVLLTRGTGGTARETDVAYGANGFVDSMTDPLGRTHAFSRDLVGRIVARSRPDSDVIAMSYDDNGNLDRITPPSQPEHALAYDATDRITSYDPPLVTGVPSPSATYDYTLDHEIDLITRPDGQTMEVVYDAATGQLLTVVTPLGNYSVAYDSAERMEVVSDPFGGTLSYTYDGPLVMSETLAGDVDGSVGWTYDDHLRVATQSVNGASAVSFSYDDDGIVVAAGSATLTQDVATGLLAGLSVGDVGAILDYSEFAELSTLTYNYDSSTMFDVTYARDAAGRIESFEETLGTSTREVEYEYDLAGRLETVTIDSTLAATYEYDDNGNRTAVITSAGTVSASYDDQDRLLTFADYEYAYTAAGELLSRTDTTTTDITHYDYDVVGNLRSVELPDSTLIEYVTDARGRRVGKSIDGVPERGWLYGDQVNIVAELDDEGDLVSRFVYAPATNVPLYMVQGGTTYAFVSDHLGSVRLVVDVGTGTVAQQLDYDPWGAVLTDTNPGFQPFGFAGGLYDPDTGLVRFGARDYDPEVGRWTSKDPILFNGGDENLYAYTRNDPINAIDPDGRFPYIPDRVRGGPVTLLVESWLALFELVAAHKELRHDNAFNANPLLDKYYHCLGNCRAAAWGEGGEFAAFLLTEFNELTDEYLSFHPPAKCDEDRAANDIGRYFGAHGQSCRLACADMYLASGRPR